MAIKEVLLAELKREAVSTKKILERVPWEHQEWKPHEKSLTLGILATHIADIPHWVSEIIHIDDFDLQQHYKSVSASSFEEMMNIYQDRLDKAVADLEKVEDTDLMKTWKFRNGEHIIAEAPKVGIMRSIAFNHLIHHRGQLSVYLRLLDVPIPGMYGPSADEK